LDSIEHSSINSKIHRTNSAKSNAVKIERTSLSTDKQGYVPCNSTYRVSTTIFTVVLFKIHQSSVPVTRKAGCSYLLCF